MDDNWKAFAVTIMVVMAALTVYGCVLGFVRWFKIPRHVRDAHFELRDAVSARNGGNATKEQINRIEDALRVGMVNTGFYVDRDECTRIVYYVTKTANRYRFEGRYPTMADSDAELAELRIG